MTDLDPYDPALKYPQEWGRELRVAALKYWQDGNKTHPVYWAKDHEWKSLRGVEFITTKDVTKDLMGRVAFALSDEKNTFIAYRSGLSYTKHGNEHIQEDYYEKGLRWDWEKQRERGVIWMAKTRLRTNIESLGV